MAKTEDTMFRTINVSKQDTNKYPPNIIRNQKYTAFSFLFLVLIDQFRQFFNIYFFFVSMSQLFNCYRVGPLITSFGPWLFVLILTICKEALDDFKRYVRDKEANSEKYKVVTQKGIEIKPSSSIKVGDLVVVEKNQRVPADMVVLKTQEEEGQCFIRTDQLDGETDWKLRNSVSTIQSQDLAHLFNKSKDQKSQIEIQTELESEKVVEEPEIVDLEEIKKGEEIAEEQDNDSDLDQANLSKHKSDSDSSDSNEFVQDHHMKNDDVIPIDSDEENFHDLPDVEDQFENQERSKVFNITPKPDFVDDDTPEKFQDSDFRDEELSVKSEDSDDEPNQKHKGGLLSDESESSDQTQSNSQSRLAGGDVTETEDSQPLKRETKIKIVTENEDSDLQKNEMQKSANLELKPYTSETMLQLQAAISSLFNQNIQIYADKPHKDIYNFIGKISIKSEFTDVEEPLSLDNVIWMNTVLATQGVLGSVIYTGNETRAMMNTAQPRNKFGKIEEEINFYSILLCISSVIVAGFFLFFSGFTKRFDITLVRFIIIFSSVIPISLKVTIDVARLFFYSNWIMADKEIPGCIVRNSNIPEELGRITYLLSDKTGTLTRNEMEMRKVHIGTVCFTSELNEEVTSIIKKKLSKKAKSKRDISTKVYDLVCALALCHNVTPVIEDNERIYQASSPDEVALVKWCENIGVVLQQRTKDKIIIKILDGQDKVFKVLYIFPFTSDTKRMGIIVKDTETNELLFLLKGADMIMKKIVEKNDWLDEEVDNMAREGLRTLVIGMKRLSKTEFKTFEEDFKMANTALNDRSEKIQAVICGLEKNLKLLGLTGVEDKLQENVEQSLENLRNAGVKIWMLTGDKIETAISISISSRLFIKRAQYEILRVTSREEAWQKLSELKNKMINYIIIDGSSLQVMIEQYMKEFILYAATLDAVVCCRCTPTQKALVARNLRMYTPHRVACIGDGGNDVSMITEANVGIGIVGKEGNQASLAADFSILKFSDVTTLFFWHGRNCYRGTAKLIQFIIHRGTIISVMQGIFSAVFGFSPIALYQGFLMVGYVCIYTMFPMWCIILDRDVSRTNVFKFPELYKEMVQNKILSARSFVSWNLISFYQGSVIMIMTFYAFEHELISLISVTFSCLILNELLVVLLMVSSINKWMLLSQAISCILYIISFKFLDELKISGSGMNFILYITAISAVAIFFSVVETFYLRIIKPPAYSKIATATARLGED
ncbi:phospholipid-translocating P-type ATPase, flippase [Pseudoloma neurophilia]|uniref:Phospholipid-transporting ATPase n=1 Tax=Pseudoloma neurophilia TaxID=146866 RepID=A0A0R0LYL7_9MICR|nr:phospholipid-translocating P-type ATPase, flippase [Pseudoloma neurophilia]